MLAIVAECFPARRCEGSRKSIAAGLFFSVDLIVELANLFSHDHCIQAGITVPACGSIIAFREQQEQGRGRIGNGKS